MASSKFQTKLASLIQMVMIMVTLAPQPSLALDCGQIVFSLMPCLGYLTQGGPIPAECCGAVKKLAGSADTTPLAEKFVRVLNRQLRTWALTMSMLISFLVGAMLTTKSTLVLILIAPRWSKLSRRKR
ncbi:unnamed protein product [Amaranthus hypochondriacus]